MRRTLIALFFLFFMPMSIVFLAEAMEETVSETTSVSELLSRLGKNISTFKSLKTEFIQEKDLAMFKNKINIKGRIYIQKPNKLAWHVDKPMRYFMLITDKVIRQWDGETNSVQEISLSKNPVFQNVVNQMTVWFSGDYSSLLVDNEAHLLRSAPIVIDFVPNKTNIARKVIKSVTITFREDEKYIERIKIQEISGDVTTIIFVNTELDVSLDSSFFEVSPKK